MAKNIVYLHQYFLTPDDAGGTRSYWITKKLIKEGYNITVITSSNLYKGEKNINGIKIIYLKIPYDQKYSLLKRFVSFMKFSFFSLIEISKLRKIDLIIATSTPLTIGIPALFFKLFYKIPYIFEVRDLWPDVPIEMGAIKNRILIFLIKKYEIYIYKKSEHVVTLSPGMQNGVSKYISNDKISIIPNFSNNDIYFPRKKNLSLNDKYNLVNDSFKIIYFGSMGIANDIDIIINSAILFENDLNIEFIFAGDGSEKTKAINKCVLHGIKNVKFLGKIPMIDLAELINLCDISIVTFKDIPILYTNSPNKFFDSLAAGKPILLNSNGWTKDIIEKNKCGFYFDPQDYYSLYNLIINLRNNDVLLSSMSINSKNIALKYFDKTILTNKFSKIVQNILSE